MNVSESNRHAALGISMLGAGLVTAQFVAGKAARDAIYLARLGPASLPQIVVATSIVSILLVGASSKVLRRFSSDVVVPAAFVVSALLFLVEWLAAASFPSGAARLVYLHVAGFGPMLGSGFWLMATDRFDPHTARKHFGQILGSGTLGGLLGALLAERVGALFDAWTMLPMLAVLNLVCAWQLRRFVERGDAEVPAEPGDLAPDLVTEPAASGLRVLASTPYLRHLASLVLLGSIAAALVDYVFKSQAAGVFGRGPDLLRFFAAYYAATGLIAFAVQTTISRVALERFGLVAAAGTPSAALFVGGCGAFLAPGLLGVTVARGAESVLRSSLFRSGYEVFFTPMATKDKRAAKSIIDVGFDRLGDAVGGGALRLSQLLPMAQQYNVILAAALGCSALAMLVASRLSDGYVRTLERSLLNRAVELDLSDVKDTLTRTVMVRTLQQSAASKRPATVTTAGANAARPSQPQPARVTVADPEFEDILELRSRDATRIRRVLRRDLGLPAALVPHAIALLAWEPVASDAVFALRKVAEERVGELIDALIDPNQPFAVRRRLARVFSVCVSQRATDGLMLGLDDLRFEVRFQSGRSLASILERNPRVAVNSRAVFDVVLREVDVGRPVWESRQLLDRLDDPDHRSFVDEFVEDRASQSLAHVFTLLSLVLPAEPLRTAFRALHTDDNRLRGTALEYLEGVLPPTVRQRLWPFLEDRRTLSPGSAGARSREEIVADLLRSNQSIMLNLEELRRRARGAQPGVASVEDRSQS